MMHIAPALAFACLLAAQDPAPSAPAPAAQRDAPAPAAAPPAPSGPNVAVPDLVERLLALRPADPQAYFDLGEEVAFEIRTERGRRLARTLFVLAAELDRADRTPRGLLPSACLALASIADSEDERRWLRALAAVESGARLSPEDRRPPAPSDASFKLALAVAHARAQEGREARQLVDEPDVARLIAQMGASLDPVRFMFEHAAAEPACPNCRNRRTVRTVSADDGALTQENFVLCVVCRGNPGMRLSEAQFARSLAIELDLLAARPRGWSSAVLIGRDSPFSDPDPGELASTYGVDPSAPCWHPADEAAPEPLDGKWETFSMKALEGRRRGAG
ncbi:MAG: hypothetical protein SFZ24_04915 [Planctomycetota bacterium]|nr:hypothetical protein [Planctomycetota bacterium]